MYPPLLILEDGSGIISIHFAYLAPEGVIYQRGIRLGAGKEVWRIACAPEACDLHAMPNRPFPVLRSDDPRAVNCPFCKKTEQYLKAKEAIRGLFPLAR